jgi:hypothetical protein
MTRLGPGCHATMAIFFWMTWMSGGRPGSLPLR